MSDERISDNKKESTSSSDEDAFFQHGLFVNPIHAEPDIQIQEIADNVDHNIFSDSFFSSGRTPRSGESMIFNNCISSDLLKRIDEGSPIKSNRSRRKVSDAEEEEEAKDSHSLFYSLKRNKEEPNKNKQNKYLLTVNQSGSLSDEEQDTQVTGDHPMSKMSQMSQFPTVKNKSSMECSMTQLNNPFANKSSMNNLNTMNFNVNTSSASEVNNLTYEEFLRQKYSNQNLNKLYANYEEDANLSNSTLSNLSKKISPFNEDVAFYPRNFYNNLSNNNLSTVNNSANNSNLNHLSNINYASNSRYGSGNTAVQMNKVPMINPNLVNYNYNSHNPNSNRINNLEYPRHATTPTATSNLNFLNNLGMSNMSNLNSMSNTINNNMNIMGNNVSSINSLNNLNNLHLRKPSSPNHFPGFSLSNNNLNSINMSNYISNQSNNPLSQGGMNINSLNSINNLNTMNNNLFNQNVQGAQGMQGGNYNMQSQNTNSQFSMNMNTMNLQNSLNNFNAQNSSGKDSSPDYLRNPLTLNSNINKIKKNVNLNLNNLVSQNVNLLKDQMGNINTNNMNSLPNFNNLNSPTNTENEGKSKNNQGKTGWVCSICRNFNYEVRVKCNRCGKPQMKNTTVGIPKTLSSNTLHSNYKLLSSRENVNKLQNMQQQVNMNVNNCRELINEQQLVNNINLMNLQDSDNLNNEEVSLDKSEKSENFKEKLENFSLKEDLVKDEKNTDKENQNTLNKANSADSKKKKKPFVERVGDWVCIKCKNLNFSFRVVCNRCQLTKAESEKLFDQYMKNLMNYVKINELLQNQLNLNQGQSINSQGNIINNNPNMSNSSNYGSQHDSEEEGNDHNSNEYRSEYQNQNEFYSGEERMMSNPINSGNSGNKK
jgi:hypothetical protein